MRELGGAAPRSQTR